MKKMFFAVLLFVLLFPVLAGAFAVTTEMQAYTNFDPNVVTLSSTTTTLIFDADATVINQNFYNGTGVTVYVGDSSTVTNSTSTAAGGWPVASGSSFSPDDPGIFKGTLYGILAAGSTGSAPLKKLIQKK